MLVRMDVFEAVAEPSRRALLDVLAEGERTAGELVATLPNLTQPAVSRHLRVLREVGLVEVRPDAQRRIYALRADGLVEIDRWLGAYRRYWAAHLDSLEHHLARTHGQRTDTPGEHA
jgi:DNA-binding transcriptional ArsR family regulator